MKKFFSKYFNRAYGFIAGVLSVIVIAGLTICGIITWCAGLVLKKESENQKSTQTEKDKT